MFWWLWRPPNYCATAQKLLDRISQALLGNPLLLLLLLLPVIVLE